MIFKQDRMSCLERIDALFSYERPDRVSIGSLNPGFQVKNFGLPIAAAYQDPEKNFKAMLWTIEQYRWDPLSPLIGHVVLGALDFGGEVRLPQGEYEGSLVVKSHPVKTEFDVEDLKLPDPKTVGNVTKAMIFSKLQASYGMPVMFYFRSPFTFGAQMCGLDLFCRWMIRKPALCIQLMDIAIEHIFNVLSYWVETFGAESLLVWMSSPSESNQLISPRFFEKFALPYHIRCQEQMRALGLKRFGFHICGDQNKNLPILSAASPWLHPSILSFGHEVELEKAAAFFPKDIIFGNLEPTLIQLGPPEMIYKRTHEILTKGKRFEGGFVLGPGCGFPVFAPPAHAYAITKAVYESGWYK